MEDQPTNPYNVDFLLKSLGIDGGPIAFFQQHPISASLIALVLIIFVSWYIRRDRRVNDK